MAEEILKALASDRGIPVEVGSAGTAALVDEPIAPRAREALEEIGTYSGGHRARQVEASMLEEADVVLAMTARHVEALVRLSPGSAEKVHTLPSYALGAREYEGISDPYGQPISAFRICARRLLDCADGLLPKLQKGR